jgi:uncharacterized protein YjeT (DUF2065 family)
MPQLKISFRDVIALIIILGGGLYFFYISSARFPMALLKDVSDIKMAIVSIVTMVIGYYFGASKKTDEVK